MILNLSSNVIGGSNDEPYFPHKLLLTDTQVLSLCQAFANRSSASIKLSKLIHLKCCSQEEISDTWMGSNKSRGKNNGNKSRRGAVRAGLDF